MSSETVIFRNLDLPGFGAHLLRETRKAHTLYVGVLVSALVYGVLLYFLLPIGVSDRLLTIGVTSPIFLLVVVLRHLSLKDLARLPITVTPNGIRAARLVIPGKSITSVTFLESRRAVEITYETAKGRSSRERFLQVELGDIGRFMEALATLGVSVTRKR